MFGCSSICRASTCASASASASADVQERVHKWQLQIFNVENFNQNAIKSILVNVGVTSMRHSL